MKYCGLDVCKEIIFHYGVTFLKDDKPLPASFVMGTLSRYCRLHARGDLLLYGIRLYPWGLATFTEKPVKLFNDRFIPTARLFPEPATAALSKLEQSISATNDLPCANSTGIFLAFSDHRSEIESPSDRRAQTAL